MTPYVGMQVEFWPKQRGAYQMVDAKQYLMGFITGVHPQKLNAGFDASPVLVNVAFFGGTGVHHRLEKVRWMEVGQERPANVDCCNAATSLAWPLVAIIQRLTAIEGCMPPSNCGERANPTTAPSFLQVPPLSDEVRELIRAEVLAMSVTCPEPAPPLPAKRFYGPRDSDLVSTTIPPANVENLLPPMTAGSWQEPESIANYHPPVAEAATDEA